MARALPAVAVVIADLVVYTTVPAERSMQAELLPRRAGKGSTGSSWQGTAVASRSRWPSRSSGSIRSLRYRRQTVNGVLPGRPTLPPDRRARV